MTMTVLQKESLELRSSGYAANSKQFITDDSIRIKRPPLEMEVLRPGSKVLA